MSFLMCPGAPPRFSRDWGGSSRYELYGSWTKSCTKDDDYPMVYKGLNHPRQDFVHQQ